MTIVTLIVLEDAQVDMERHADGLRNWRLGHPDDRGPPKVRVLALDARRSTLHTIHDGIGLVGDAAIAPLPQPRAVPGHADLPLTKHLVFKGTYKGHAFDVASDVSDVLAFGATSRRFSLDGTGHAGGVRLGAAGTSTSVTTLADFDVDATLASVDGGVLWPLPEVLGRARPLAARGHVSKVDMAWTATGLRATLGKRTALAGDVHFTGSLKDDTQRRILNTTLHDVVLDTDDLRALAGKSNDGKTTTPVAPMISAAPLPTARLRTFDADVDLKDARIVGPDSAFAQKPAPARDARAAGPAARRRVRSRRGGRPRDRHAAVRRHGRAQHARARPDGACDRSRRAVAQAREGRQPDRPRRRACAAAIARRLAARAGRRAGRHGDRVARARRERVEAARREAEPRRRRVAAHVGCSTSPIACRCSARK